MTTKLQCTHINCCVHTQACGWIALAGEMSVEREVRLLISLLMKGRIRDHFGVSSKNDCYLDPTIPRTD
jgi:hypothetical protein